MYYEGTIATLQQQVNTLNSEWIVEYKKLYPNDKVTQRYCDLIEIFGVGYVIKDEVTEPYITEYTAIVEVLPEKPLWHDDTCSIQIQMTQEDNLKLLTLYDAFATYCNAHSIKPVLENGNTYVYVNEILPEHIAMFQDAEQKLGITININYKQ